MEIQMRLKCWSGGDNSTPGPILITSGLQSLIATSAKQIEDLVRVVASFDRFDGDNDPHGEHDFGQFDFEDKSCFWKIDYYNLSQDGGSKDPSDLTQTHRVLTISLTRPSACARAHSLT